MRAKLNRPQKSLYKYVSVGVWIWVVFVASFILAYERVGNSEAFEGVPFKSLGLEETQKPSLSY